ncbi:MAG: hypothetical protein FGM14_08750 [Flavobacteriales bacterium]|nr:hypothetical protein [Flavobacteriales bacterium]
MKKSFLILFVSLLNFCFGQHATTEKRIEIEFADNYLEERVIPMGKNGFVLHSRQKQMPKGKKTLKYTKYNSDLELIGEKELVVTSNMSSKDYVVDNNFLYMAYTHTPSGNFTVTRYDIVTEEIKEFSGKSEKGARIVDFNVLNGVYYFFCNKKGQHSMMIVDLDKQEITNKPLNFEVKFPKTVSLSNFQVMENSNELTLSIDFRESTKDIKSYFVILNDKAEITTFYDLSETEGKYIVNSTATKIGENDYIVTGNFSLGRSATMSHGLYIAIIKGGKIDKINFYNFADLKNFFSYKSEKEQEKIEKKKDKAEAKGKDFIVSQFLATHNVSKIENDYFLLAEAYYPTYRTVTTTNSNGSVSTREVFDGFQYTHAFMVRFDKDANIVWDQSVKMYLFYKPMTVKRFVNVSKTEKGNISLVFADAKVIKSKIIDFNGNTVSEVNSEMIETGDEDDKTVRSISNIDFWYDTFFLNYGSQKIKNKGDDDQKGKRFVFFVSKVKL